MEKSFIMTTMSKILYNFVQSTYSFQTVYFSQRGLLKKSYRDTEHEIKQTTSNKHLKRAKLRLIS